MGLFSQTREPREVTSSSDEYGVHKIEDKRQKQTTQSSVSSRRNPPNISGGNHEGAALAALAASGASGAVAPSTTGSNHSGHTMTVEQYISYVTKRIKNPNATNTIIRGLVNGLYSHNPNMDPKQMLKYIKDRI